MKDTMRMNINTHTFEDAKEQIAEFSQKISPFIYFNQVSSEGLIPIFDHLVTGKEMNDFILEVQKYLEGFNSLHMKCVKMFGQVYTALDSLDKDYIQAILVALYAAEEAAEEACQAQQKINKTIEIQRKTLLALEQFKDQVDQYDHLKDIDEMWRDLKRLNKEIEYVKYNVEYLSGFLEKRNTAGREKDLSVETVSSKAPKQDMCNRKKDRSVNPYMVLKRKVAFAYLLAGSAISLSVLQLIMNVLGIL